MRTARFYGVPVRRARATFLDEIFPRHIFIPLFIIFAAACLVLAGCTDEDVVAPDDDDDDGPANPVCPEELPSVEITVPSTGDGDFYPRRITFTFAGAPGDMIARTRHLMTEIPLPESGIDTLNAHPELFEDLWTDWEAISPEGRSVTFGSDIPLDERRKYMFAVQAMDSCGKVTEAFSRDLNARQFLVVTSNPILSVFGKNLGAASFIGSDMRPAPIHVPPLAGLWFVWEGTNSYSWFGPVEYRCGWDIQNLGDDDEWYGWSDRVRTYWEKRFSSGVHVFYIEARDEAGNITRARIEIEVIPFPMGRDLLLIDDFLLDPNVSPNRILPSESEHDAFWESICSRAPGFDAVRDICPADELYRGPSYADSPLPLDVLADYSHVIWTSDNLEENAWNRTIRFSPEPVPSPLFRPNTLALYMDAGGNVLTCGRGDRNSSLLGATFSPQTRPPASILDDLGGGPAGNRAGRYSMAYSEYRVSVVDKVSAYFTDDMPAGVVRSLDRDAMMFAMKTSCGYGLPDTLRLSEYVTVPGMFWDPYVRGFYMVEAYDPQYYMEYRGIYYSQECFIPMYRMRSRNSLSPLNGAAVALELPGDWCDDFGSNLGESFHFGFPLWYFDHGQVEQIADYVFEQWEIR